MNSGGLAPMRMVTALHKGTQQGIVNQKEIL